MIREEVIRKMYQYKAEEDDMAIVPDTLEVIDNWYVFGFDTVENLEKVFDIEDVYDMDIDVKFYPKDMYIEKKRIT